MEAVELSAIDKNWTAIQLQTPPLQARRHYLSQGCDTREVSVSCE